jgi:hypothetical protein
VAAWRILLLAAFLAAGWLVHAPSSAQDKKGAKSGYERSAPGEGQKFLEKFVGDWHVVKSFHSRDGKPVRAEGTCTQTMIHDGRFLRSDFVFGTGDAKTTGMGLIGFEAKTGRFTSVWTDSRTTRMSFRQGKDKFDGKQIVLHSATLDDGTPREGRRSYTVTRLEDGGDKIVHRQYGAGDDGKERLTMELLLTRKPPARPARD